MKFKSPHTSYNFHLYTDLRYKCYSPNKYVRLLKYHLNTFPLIECVLINLSRISVYNEGIPIEWSIQ